MFPCSTIDSQNIYFDDFHLCAFLLLDFCMSKYLGPLLILGGNFYLLYLDYLEESFIADHFKSSRPVVILSVAWFLTLSLNNGSLIRNYPIEYYPSQVLSTSFGTFLKDLMVCIIRDIGISVTLCYVGLMLKLNEKKERVTSSTDNV